MVHNGTSKVLKTTKIFVCKLGQDGHDRGAKVVASSFADLGCEVELSKLFLTPEELFSQASQLEKEDTDLEVEWQLNLVE